MRARPGENEETTFNGIVPLHFYGELVKTAEGLVILEAKGHFKEFVDYIRAHGMEESDAELLEKLKSVLWAVVRSYGRPNISTDPNKSRAISVPLREESVS